MYDDDAVMTMKQASNMFDVHFTSQVIHSKMFVLLLNIQTPENRCFFSENPRFVICRKIIDS